MVANGVNGKQFSKEDGCCSINLLKYLLFIFNFIFMVSGILVMGIGIWTVVAKHNFVNLLSTATYVSIAYLFITAGVIVLIVTFIGCIGIWREDKRALLLYTFLLVFIFLLEAIGGIMAYAYEGQLRTDLESSLNRTFLYNYQFDEAITRDIDELQTQYRCCGAVNYEDWKYSRWLLRASVSKINKINNTVPDSCCKTRSLYCGARNHPSNINERSCISKFEGIIREHLVLLGAIGLGICLVQVFGIIISGCLYVKLKRYEDRLY
ncbi:hypothetical protein CHUAL_010218 [Chamberlinius hualienensis]